MFSPECLIMHTHAHTHIWIVLSGPGRPRQKWAGLRKTGQWGCLEGSCRRWRSCRSIRSDCPERTSRNSCSWTTSILALKNRLWRYKEPCWFMAITYMMLFPSKWISLTNNCQSLVYSLHLSLLLLRKTSADVKSVINFWERDGEVEFLKKTPKKQIMHFGRDSIVFLIEDTILWWTMIHLLFQCLLLNK